LDPVPACEKCGRLADGPLDPKTKPSPYAPNPRNVAQILGAVAVIAGIAFRLTQVRQFRQQRQDALAVELMKSIQDAEFTRSLRILVEVPHNTSAAEFRSLGPTVEEAAWALGAKYETFGYLVYRGIMPIDMVEE
jgi:hypothetical protein